jgi:cell shape-determining protein MreC
MTNENLTEEGKRLEVALRYVTQINDELRNELGSAEQRMQDYEEIIDENQSLKLLLIPNGQSLEKMSETLRRDTIKLKKDLRAKQTELERIYQDKTYSNYNEKQVADRVKEID